MGMGGVRARVGFFGGTTDRSTKTGLDRSEGRRGGDLLAASARWVLLRTHGAPSALLRPEL